MPRHVHYRSGLTILAIIFFVLSCQTSHSSSIAEEKEQILKLHHAQRDYHFKKDSVAFANQLSDNFISVNRGVITTPKREETIARYNGYFSAVEFLKWDDVSDPIIRFSDDGSMAYTIVDKIVATTSPDEQGNNIEGSTHFAWTAIYRKHNGAWKIDCVTSTNKPIE
ncbi:MAG: nuclear transport factor 2 family protein [Calditrichia bacterium]